MKMFDWFFNFFRSKKPKAKYNLLIVRSEDCPTIEIAGNQSKLYFDKKKSSVNISKYVNPEDDTDFRPIPEKFILSPIPGSEKAWYIKIKYVSDKTRIGTCCFYLAKRDAKKGKQGDKKKAWVIKSLIDKSTVRDILACEPGQQEEERLATESEINQLDKLAESAPSETTAAKELNQSADNPAETPGVKSDAARNQTKKSETAEQTEASAADLPVEQGEEHEPQTGSTGEDKNETSVQMNESHDPQNTELTDLKAEISELRDELINQLKAMGMNNTPDESTVAELLAELKTRIGKLNEQAESDKATARQQAEQQAEEIKTLITAKNEKDKEIGRLKNEASDTERRSRKVAEDFEAVKGEYERQLADKNSEIERLKACDAAQLDAQNKSLEIELADLNQQLDDAKDKIIKKDSTIQEKSDKLQEVSEKRDELNTRLTRLTGERDKLSKDLEKTQAELEKAVADYGKAEAELKENKTLLESTRENFSKARHEISALNSTVGAREHQIKKLETDIAQLGAERESLTAVIGSDIKSLEQVYTDAVARLSAAVAGDFLSECNADTETDTIESMCGKIRRGVEKVAKDVTELCRQNFGSASELAQGYDAIIADNISCHAFTEIARWWAYSRLPFIADKSRDEGRSVSIKAINAAYAALERLLALAGYQYQLPALFVENLNEGDYDDQTGKAQLNLDYQYPNVRTHAENIDRSDRANTVLDIVQLGYYKNGQLERKTSVIR